MKRKLPIVILCALMALVCAFTLSACGDGEGDKKSSEDIDWSAVYTLDGGTITGLTEQGKMLSVIEIPSEIDEVVITAVGDGAFYECDNLKNVTIADSVTMQNT